MRYFNVEIQETKESASAAIYEATSKDAAISAFHTSMASMRASVDAGTLTAATGLVINSWGGVEDPYKEHYEKQEQPESEVVGV